MSQAFSATLRALDRERPDNAWAAWVLALAFLVLWGSWFAFGRINVYETSDAARVEARESPRALSSLVSARIVSAPAHVGQRVKAGETIFELDASPERLKLAEHQAEGATLPTRIAALESEIKALEAALGADETADAAARQGLRIRLEEARARAAFAADTARRLHDESQAGGVSRLEAQKGDEAAREADAAQRALMAEGRRLDSEALARRHAAEANIAARRRDLALMRGDMASSALGAARLGQEADRYVVRAPVAGVLTEIAPLKPGAVVSEGQNLATVAPDGGLKIVAQFQPGSAEGRVRAGQHAELALEGYPWTRFGRLDAVVRSVASDLRDGKIRVELDVVDTEHARRLLKHGLPGAVDVAVERASPLDIVLRTLGRGHD